MYTKKEGSGEELHSRSEVAKPAQKKRERERRREDGEAKRRRDQR